ncbi:acyl-CoA N-acyltransferase [Venturia nashicola]|uniref:Acyl-CoA N-acyltransferase n=1 Tax=Venturia nashicola TaxID=86259 RepID=A0A4Z1P3R2_9PEZI|nr:acyl-CoA N-acyltransferase [Venturia nashicola]
MSREPPILGAVVTNTDPARLPSLEPLIGRDVRLERLKQDHFPSLYENIGSHDDIWTWWPEGPFSDLEFEQSLRHFIAVGPGIASYTVILLTGSHKDKAAGILFAFSEDRLTNRVAEIGLIFGPMLQRSKAGTEAIYILANHIFELNYRRLQWKTNSLNLRSRKAAERYGFAYEGTFRQHQINKGRNRDTSWYSILDLEWSLCKEAFEAWLRDDNFDEQQGQKRKLVEIRKSLEQTRLF